MYSLIEKRYESRLKENSKFIIFWDRMYNIEFKQVF